MWCTPSIITPNIVPIIIIKLIKVANPLKVFTWKDKLNGLKTSKAMNKEMANKNPGKVWANKWEYSKLGNWTEIFPTPITEWILS